MAYSAQEPLRELAGRLIDTGKAFVQAEIALAKAKATNWAGHIKVAAIFLVAAVLLLIVGLVVLFVALGWTLAIWIGPAAGLALSALTALAVAGLLAWLGSRRLARLGQ